MIFKVKQLMKSIKYVLNENIQNIYRMLCIVKYEILSENRDSNLGMLWVVLDPLIQILSYWFAFGVGIRGGNPINDIPYITWMLAGIVPWFFLSASIREGVSSIHRKNSILKKMKFPISILPTTVVFKAAFYHVVTFMITYVFIVFKGLKPSWNNFNIIYYLFATIAFSISLSMITSVLNMFTRDVKKAINASMRLLMFVTPILWTMEKLPEKIQIIMKCNPIYYIVEGYRESLFTQNTMLDRGYETIVFWLIVTIFFMIGSTLMYKFKHKLIDFI